MILSAEGLRARALVLRACRDFLHRRGYLEVPTPTLVRCPALEEHLHPVAAEGGLLRTSPELALKRVVAAGLPRIYELGPCFRDREGGPWHGREFLMLEWYRVGAGLPDLMDEVDGLVQAAAEALGVQAPTWQRVTVRELFLKRAGLDPATATATDLSARDEAWNDAFFRRWLEDVEPTLQGALFIEDWPATQAALAQVRDDGPWPVARRFEAFLHGVELANAFQELIDPAEQRVRALAVNQARVAAGEAPFPLDEAFLAAVGRLPPTAGIALGLERLVAALCGWDGIGQGRVAG